MIRRALGVGSLMRLALVCLFCTSASAKPARDWARELRHTVISTDTAWRDDGAVSFTMILDRDPDSAGQSRTVSIIPLAALPPTVGELSEIKQRVDPVDEKSPQWEAKVVSIAKSYASAKAPAERREEFPFDAVLISPARTGAKLVATPKKLPKGLVATDIRAALDLDGDGAADVLLWQNILEEDYTQGGTYAKTPRGWKSIDAWEPL